MTRLAVLALTACLLAGCTGEPDAGESPAAEPTTATAEPRPDAPAQATAEPQLQPMPTVPARRADKLARQLDRAFTTLRADSSSEADLRAAGEFQQVALRTIAHVDPGFGRTVIAHLPPETAKLAGAGIRAARELDSLTDPQSRLPRWRIVAPESREDLLGHYRAADRRLGVPWNYLAAIHLVETRMGRIRGTSTAGARGPMQFIAPTWARYGAGGDITDARDSILAAARLLRANGAPGDMAEALWHYNPSDHYVRAVSEYAESLRQADWLYRGYWQWRVLYKHQRGTYALEVGYPRTEPEPVPDG